MQCTPATPEHACTGLCTHASPAVHATGGSPPHKTLRGVRVPIKPLGRASLSQGIPGFTLSWRPLPAPRPDGSARGTCTSVHKHPAAGAVHMCSGQIHLHTRQQHRRASSAKPSAGTAGRLSTHAAHALVRQPTRSAATTAMSGRGWYPQKATAGHPSTHAAHAPVKSYTIGSGTACVTWRLNSGCCSISSIFNFVSTSGVVTSSQPITSGATDGCGTCRTK